MDWLKSLGNFIRCLHPVGGWVVLAATTIFVGWAVGELFFPAESGMPEFLKVIIYFFMGAFWPARFDNERFEKLTGERLP